MPENTPDTERQEITSRTVVCLFSQRAVAEAAITDLQAAGFPRDRIGMATQDQQAAAAGLSDDDATHFAGGLHAGGTLVTVDARARTPEALAILQRHQADFGPGGAGRFESLDWSAKDNSNPAAAATAPYAGVERRIIQDPAYTGPERRLLGV